MGRTISDMYCCKKRESRVRLERAFLHPSLDTVGKESVCSTRRGVR